MAILFLLLAIIGAAVVADLVLENTAADAITVLNQPITGYRDGLLLAMAAAIGLVVGLLVVGSVSMRRTRRTRRKQLRTAERELSRQLLELERENSRLREELARRDLAVRRSVRVPAAADPEAPATTRTVASPRADPQKEPVYEAARQAARLRSSSDPSFPSTHR
jgi:uncharacterized membrane protein YccC